MSETPHTSSIPEPFDPAEFGLDPINNESDRWLLEASHGDLQLFLLHRSQEELGRLHASKEAGSDYQEKMADWGRRIDARKKELGLS
jgi:hypothetical protein